MAEGVSGIAMNPHKGYNFHQMGKDKLPMGIVIKSVIAAVGDPATAKTVDLRIDNGVITAVDEQPLPSSTDDMIVDGRGRFALPGMINAHTHLPMSLFRGLADDVTLDTWLNRYIWPAEKRLTDDDVYWGSLLSLAEMIKSGTTQVADMYFHTDSIARAVTDAHMRAVLSYGIVAGELDEHGKNELRKAQEVINRWEGASSGRIRTAVSPHAIYTCGKDVWTAAVDLAQQKHVPLHIHLSETREEVTWAKEKWGETPVRALDKLGVFSVPTIAAHCVHVTEQEIQILADRRITAVHCPKSNAKLGNGHAPVVSLLKAGVNVALGTDGAASNNSQDMIEEMRMASLLQKAQLENPTVLPAREVTMMATRNGADALGMGARRIAVGEDADVVLVDLSGVDTVPAYNPFSALVYAGHASDVTDVIVAGEYLLRDRKLLTIDEERVKYEIGRRFGRLAAN